MKTWKRMLVLILLVACAVMLTGCGKGPDETASGSSPKTEASAVPAPEGSAEPGETAAPVPEPVSETGRALDAAFAAGKVVFVQSDLQLPDLKACEINLPPDSFWEAFDEIRPTEEEFRLKTGDSELTVFSYAPDGSAGIGWIANAPVAFTENSITLLYPAADRGVGDRYDVLRNIYNDYSDSRKAFCTDKQGITWSPKGHYFCALNYNKMAFANNAAYGCPVITDTRTGEIFCLDAINPSRNASEPGEYGMWLTGCFSEDEQFFYAIYNGFRYGRSMILRYSLEDYSCTMLESMADIENDYFAYPGLAVSPNGTVTALVSARISSWKQSILRTGSSLVSRQIPLSMFTENDLKIISPARRMVASGASGEALVMFEAQPAGGPVLFRNPLMHIRLDDPEKGMDTVFAVRENPLRLEAWTAADFAEAAGKDKEELNEIVLEYMAIVDVILSPDGRYAAVLAGNQYTRNVALLIVRLEDMAMLPAEAALLDQLSFRDISQYANQKNCLLNWSESGLLVVPTSMMFRIQAD